jgi:type II secretion system protein N
MRLGRVALAAVLFTAILAFTFPTDAVLRRVVARVTPPDGPRLEFAHASLRPSGLRLDAPSLRNPDGSIVAAAEWLLLRPSLWGLVRDRTGRPWRATGGVCGGSLEARLDGDGDGSALTLDWRELDLSSCSLVPAGGALEGRAEGTVHLRLARDTPLAGEGNANVRSAMLRMAGLGLPLEALHADPVFVRWQLVADKITFSTIQLHGPELRVNGSGTVRLKQSLADTALNLRLIVTPGPEAPPPVLAALTHLPPASGIPGARLLLVVGTITELRRLI